MPADASLTMQLLPVEVPVIEERGARLRTAVPLERRLAVNVAALFGVHGGEAGVGRTWVARVDDLSLRELARGVPNEFEGIALDEIAAATLNRFRPDRKFGAVLAGADHLFDSLGPVFEDVMRTIGTTPANRPLNSDVRLALWVVLVQEAYRSQPALFIAAVTARSVQRMQVRETDAVLRPVHELEIVAPARSNLRVQTRLSLLDDTVPERDLLFSWGGEQASLSFLQEETIERVVSHLLESDTGGRAWIEADGQHASAYLASVDVLNGLLSELPPREHVPDLEQLLPRLPSAGELIRLPLRSQRATIWAAMQVHRVLRDNARFYGGESERRVQTAVTGQALELDELARAVLAEHDPLLQFTRARWLNKKVADLRETDWPAALEALRELRGEIDLLKHKHDAGQVDDGSLADLLGGLSTLFTALLGDAQAHEDHSATREIQADLEDDWQRFFDAVQVRADARDPMAVGRALLHDPFAWHLQEYVAFLLHSEDMAVVRAAARLTREVLLPARRLHQQRYGRSRALRRTLQVYIRLLDRLFVASTTREERMELAIEVRGAAVELQDDPTVRQLLDPERRSAPRSGEVNTLTALLIAYLVGSELQPQLRAVEPVLAARLLKEARAALQQRSRGGGTSGREHQLNVITARLERLARTDSASATRSTPASVLRTTEDRR